MYDTYLSRLEKVKEVGLTPIEAMFLEGAMNSTIISLHQDRKLASHLMMNVEDTIQCGGTPLEGFDGQDLVHRLRDLPMNAQAALAVWANLVWFAKNTKRLKPSELALCDGDRNALTRWTAKGIAGYVKHRYIGGNRYVFKTLDECIDEGITDHNCILIGLVLEHYRTINAPKFTEYWAKVV